MAAALAGGEVRSVASFKAGPLYFGIVFAAGFALAPLRELWGIPVFGARAGGLLEFPLMLVVIVIAAAWLNRRLLAGASAWRRLGAGVLALCCMPGAELAVVWRLRGERLSDYVAARDPVTGSVYLVMLAVFALMPWLPGRRSSVR